MTKDALYRESVVHRSGSLPMKIYKSSYVRYHWHDEYEFLVSNNDGAQCTVNGQQLTLNKDDALMIRGGKLHSLHLDLGKSVNAIVVHPKLWLGNEFGEEFERLAFPTFFSKDSELGTEVITLLKQAIDCYNNKPFGYEFRLKSIFCSLFARFLELGEYKEQDKIEKHDFSAKHQIFEYIHTHFSEQITLDSLCEVAHYSKSYIIRLFKKHTGQTPAEYIIRYRVERAKELLSENYRNVLDVSLECGFSSVSYFIKIFKQYTGTTPHKYLLNNKYGKINSDDQQ
jgi:AraC-like DNA-binding protein